MKPSSKILKCVAASCVLSVGVLMSGGVVAAPKGTGICKEEARGARGICRAAVKSGCEIGGRRENSRHCAKLESYFRRKTGRDPVWREPVVEEEPAPAPEPVPLPTEPDTPTSTFPSPLPTGDS